MTDDTRPEPNDDGASETRDGDPLFAAEDEEAVDDPFAELGAGVDGVDGDDRDRDRTGAAPTPDPDSIDSIDSVDPFDELGPAADGDGDDAFDGALDDAFDRMDVGETTGESVWEALDEDAAGVGETVGAGAASASGDSNAASASGDSRGSGTVQGPTTAADRTATESERVVDKRAYCQQCPHFSAPPDVACGHEGTTIVEAVGFDEFRVRNCPMVTADDDAGLGADPAFDADE
ncbi:hypothetical protein C461_10423 [Halorubrum aidingense JCM 13560]|uniref:DUF8135 domain-containing protein n=1 Tax=Halorubrum aidingense JCM 13560 TaxID=1230454 RepID=M0P9E4_9EURY|nr:hypothetical protein [Halorubrum aidingense]EMA66448.1 hypothetical protein C461_10423 [Halorubrum aidingense JCM 13560]